MPAGTQESPWPPVCEIMTIEIRSRGPLTKPSAMASRNPASARDQHRHEKARALEFVARGDRQHRLRSRMAVAAAVLARTLSIEQRALNLPQLFNHFLLMHANVTEQIVKLREQFDEIVQRRRFDISLPE